MEKKVAREREKRSKHTNHEETVSWIRTGQSQKGPPNQKKKKKRKNPARGRAPQKSGNQRVCGRIGDQKDHSLRPPLKNKELRKSEEPKQSDYGLKGIPIKKKF